jgi:hypothetical protein
LNKEKTFEGDFLEPLEAFFGGEGFGARGGGERGGGRKSKQKSEQYFSG